MGAAADLPEPIAVYQFGSVARGVAHGGSDVDVALLLGLRGPTDLATHVAVTDLQSELGGLLQCAVDVALLDRAASDFVHRVLRDGELVFESDHRRRIEFEVRARSEYFDMQPIVQLYRRTVLGKV
jgi:predicted nucleotidyltransferase